MGGDAGSAASLQPSNQARCQRIFEPGFPLKGLYAAAKPFLKFAVQGFASALLLLPLCLNNFISSIVPVPGWPPSLLIAVLISFFHDVGKYFPVLLQ